MGTIVGMDMQAGISCPSDKGLWKRRK